MEFEDVCHCESGWQGVYNVSHYVLRVRKEYMKEEEEEQELFMR